MVGLPPYAGDASPEALERAYLGRDVIYLLGTKDTNPQHRALDRSCMAEAQGPYRLARGLAYTRYLRKRHGAAFQQLVFMVPGVGHSAKGILTSSCGLNALFAASPADHAEADKDVYWTRRLTNRKARGDTLPRRASSGHLIASECALPL